MALDEKYVVFKKEDFDTEVRRLGPDARFLRQAALDPETFFVIRRGDVFAPGGLHGYATNMLSTVSGIQAMAPLALTDEQAQEYLEMSLDVSERARKWETEPQKFPD